MGRDEEFELAVHENAARLFGVAVSILGDAGLAEDAVQDTMANAWRKWDSLRDPGKRDAWLRRICVRECLHSRRPQTVEIPEGAGRQDTQADLDLDRAYRALSPQQRAVIALHYHFGYALDECADLMGCRPGTARSHLDRALKSMRKELSDA